VAHLQPGSARAAGSRTLAARGRGRWCGAGRHRRRARSTRRGGDAGRRGGGVPASERWTVRWGRQGTRRRGPEPLAARRIRRRRVDVVVPGDGRLAEVTRRGRGPVNGPAGGVRRSHPLPVAVKRRLGIHAAGLSVRQLRHAHSCSSGSSALRAIATRLTPSGRFINRTPIVCRCARRTSAACVRMTTPSDVIA